MDIQKKKDYIISLVSKGLSFEKATKAVYANEEELKLLKDDNNFQNELQAIDVELQIQRLDSYNKKVNEGTASDEHKRILATMPNLFSDEAQDGENGLTLTINKVRAEVVEKKEGKE